MSRLGFLAMVYREQSPVVWIASRRINLCFTASYGLELFQPLIVFYFVNDSQMPRPCGTSSDANRWR
jgi:hypothetical protein